MTRDETGAVVRAPEEVTAGEALLTTVAGGTIMSRVVVSDAEDPPGTSSEQEATT